MRNLMTIGIDLAKSVFFLVALNEHGKKLWRKKMSRAKLMTFVARLEPCTISMEACSSAHYWGREFTALGHQVKLLPPQHVKAYLRGQKNDYNDAEAIAEACLHNRIKPVPIKTAAQQDQQMLLRMRTRLKTEKVCLSNQVRGLLAEYGIVLPKSNKAFRERVPEILEDAGNSLSPQARELIQRQYQHYQQIAEEFAWHDKRLVEMAKADEDCQRLMTAPGFGPVISCAFKTHIGDGQQFRRGRDVAAALGIVPKQHSTGGKPVLGGITKRGDKELRALFIQGAKAVLMQAARKDDGLSRWALKVKERRGANKAAVAVANKMARIGWVIIARKEQYRAA